MGRPIELLVVPYDSGHRGLRLGAGPLDLLAHGAEARAGAPPASMVEASEGFRAEGGTGFDLNRRLAEVVRGYVERGALPVVLAGNCATSLGTVAGLAAAGETVGILWLDAHGDLNTPETTRSAFLDGMALSIVMGRCWRAAAESVPGFVAVPEERVALLGARDLDPEEAAFLQDSGVTRVTVEQVRADDARAVTEAVSRLREAGATRLYLHLDMDVHDSAAVIANAYATPDGILPEESISVIRHAAAALPLGAVAITAYDPAASGDGSARGVALRLLEAIRDVA
jgi:arginase